METIGIMKRVVSMIEICEPGGLQTGPFGSQLKADEYSKAGVPVIMPKDIIAGRVCTETLARIPYDKAMVLKKHMLKTGDLLFSRRGDLAKIAVITDNETGYICGTGCLRARIKEGVNPSYLAYYLSSSSIIAWLEQNAVGQTMLNLNTEIIGQLPIRLRNYEEQRKVAEILVVWDRAIDLTERLIAAKQERRKWLVQQVLSGRRRLKSFVSSNNLLSRGSGRLPDDWDYPRLGKLAVEVSAKNTDGNGLPVLSCTKYQGLVDSLQYFGKQIFSEDLSTYKVVRRGEFAYATNHIDEGSIGYQNLYDEALISPMYTVFRANNGLIDDAFLYLLLKTETYRRIFAARTSASVDRRGSLRWKDFSKIRVPLPSLVEQQQIVRVIETADREIDLLRSQLDAFREQKKGLMQQLLTGNVGVKV